MDITNRIFRHIYYIYIIGLVLYSILGYMYIPIVESLSNIVIFKYYPLIGVVPFVYFFVKKRGELIKPSKIWVASFAFYILTSIINWKLSYQQNIKGLFWLFLVYFIVFSWNICLDDDWKAKCNCMFGVAWRICILIFLVLNIINFFLLIGGIQVYLWGVDVFGWNPDNGRFYSVVGATASLNYCRMVILVIVYSIYKFKFDTTLNAFWKVISALNAFFFFFSFISLGSRGGYLMVAFLGMSAFYFFHTKKNGIKENIYIVCSCILILFFCVLFMYAGREITYRIAGKCKFLNQNFYSCYEKILTENNEANEMYRNFQISQERTMREINERVFISKENYDSGRLDGSFNQLRIWLSKGFLFGIGLGNDGYFNSEGLTFGGYPWVDYLARKGLVGFLLDIIGVMCIYINVLREMKINKLSNDIKIATIFSLATFAFESIFFSLSFGALIFWLSMGYISRDLS